LPPLTLTAAVRQLSVSSYTCGNTVARREERLRVRLFHRSTRSITLTAEGTVFLERCRRILSEITAAESELSGLAGSPRGRLRVGTPLLGDLMMPAVDGFMERYPEVELDIDFCDRMVDVIEEGFDAVIRTGEQTDSRLAARRLGSCAHVLEPKRSEEHTSELQSRGHLVCRLLLEKKKRDCRLCIGRCTCHCYRSCLQSLQFPRSSRLVYI